MGAGHEYIGESVEDEATGRIGRVTHVWGQSVVVFWGFDQGLDAWSLIRISDLIDTKSEAGS